MYDAPEPSSVSVVYSQDLAFSVALVQNTAEQDGSSQAEKFQVSASSGMSESDISALNVKVSPSSKTAIDGGDTFEMLGFSLTWTVPVSFARS